MIKRLKCLVKSSDFDLSHEMKAKASTVSHAGKIAIATIEAITEGKVIGGASPINVWGRGGSAAALWDAGV